MLKTVTLLRKCHTVNDRHLYVLFCIKHSCTLVKQSAQCHNFFVSNYKDTNFVCDMYVYKYVRDQICQNKTK